MFFCVFVCVEHIFSVVAAIFIEQQISTRVQLDESEIMSYIRVSNKLLLGQTWINTHRPKLQKNSKRAKEKKIERVLVHLFLWCLK